MSLEYSVLSKDCSKTALHFRNNSLVLQSNGLEAICCSHQWLSGTFVIFNLQVSLSVVDLNFTLICQNIYFLALIQRERETGNWGRSRTALSKGLQAGNQTSDHLQGGCASIHGPCWDH